MRPLRFAVFVAFASAICVALGRLWVQSLDQGSAVPVERILHAGTGAVAVAIAMGAPVRAHHAVATKKRVVRRPLAPRALPRVHAAAAVAHVSAHAPVAAAAAPAGHVMPPSKPKAKPKSNSKRERVPSPTPQTPAPPEPTPTPVPPTPPEPTPPPPPPDVAPPPSSEPTPEPPDASDPTPPADPTPPCSDDDGGDNGRPGWGHGDGNHDHSGPPGHIGDWDHDRGHRHHGSGSD